jgi:hypothetical protein
MTSRIEVLQQELAKAEYADLVATQNYPAIKELLNNRLSITNPTPIGQVPKIPSIEEIIPLVGAGKVFAIAETETYNRVLEAIRAKRADWLIGNTTTLLDGGIINQNEHDLIVAKIQETELDPNYQSQIPGQSIADALGIYPVSDIDVQGALN